QGDPRHALAQSGSLVITEAIAQKYFGAADPMGQTLIFDIGLEVELHITGVMQNPPHHSHFRPDFLASLALFDDYEMLNPKDWSQTPYHSYVVLDHPRSAQRLREALPAFIEARTDELEPEVQLQPITEIHLRSRFRDELEPGGSLSYVYSFSAIALLILLIACINFINLSTARSAHRAREIGMRKVLGAQRKSLVAQFIGESLLLTLLALVLALPMVVFLLPFFNQLADKTLTLQALNVPRFLFILIGMVLLVGVVSGSYPAFFLSRFTPIRTLRGVLTHGSSGINVRKVLVVIQFVIGIMLMVGTLVIYNQLTFIGSKTLGFSTEQTLVIAARMYGHSRTPLPFEAMRNEFAAHPGVLEVAVTGNVPGTDPRQSPFFLEGMNNQDEMAQTIVAAVEPELGAAERERAARKPPESLDAWETFQRGLWHMWRFTKDDNAKGQRLLRRARELDPSFAPAHAYESYAHFLSVIVGYAEAPDQAIAAALTAAKKAVALDDKDAVAYFALGRVYTLRGEHDASIAELEMALALNPSFAQAHHALGFALALSGRLEEAAEALDKAVRLSPRGPLLWGTMVIRSLTFSLLQQYEAAAKWARKAMREPRATGYWPYAALASALGNLGQMEEARGAVDTALREKPDLTLAYLKKTLPTKHPGGLDPYLDGLRKAGLPEESREGR
ncbi:MAG: tetratricopeptide repeat protein, partial [Proteobacteria bacterium]|nr:tetratricopeptide repeat protein [Pseudomonadota bacterium]